VVERDAGHTPVLPQSVQHWLAPKPGDVVLDATIGLGGHAKLFAEAIGPDGTLIGIDVDPSNLAGAREYLADAPCEVVLERENFRRLETVLDRLDIDPVNVLFADLGVSSTQLEDPMRGFSFRHEAPLDMRLDDRITTTAADLVNSLRENELSDLIYHNSQERFSRRIAKRICQARRDRRITTTSRLADVVCQALGVDPESRKSKIHPATRVFQAFRIAVNDELGALADFLEEAPKRLCPGGRIGVISFHSLEDGLVKRDFRRRKNEGLYEVLTKRPLIADPDERQANPRSRSAKFRAAKRTE
jgi:16S rRNA (cytosine1402-N4)-methyltransferase